LKRKLNVFDAVVTAAYGSVSAVTFVTAVSCLESKELSLHSCMVAIMVLMEFPAIIIGLVLILIFYLNLQTSFLIHKLALPFKSNC